MQMWPMACDDDIKGNFFVWLVLLLLYQNRIHVFGEMRTCIGPGTNLRKIVCVYMKCRYEHEKQRAKHIHNRLTKEKHGTQQLREPE